MDAELLDEGAGFEEANALITQADAETIRQDDQSQQQGVEYIAADDAMQSAKGLVRAVMGSLNWLLQFKEPRIRWNKETIEQAEDEIAPALVKHGVGAGGISKYGEEAAAVGFLGQLGWNTRKAIIELREKDEAEAKRAKGGDRGEESERQPA